MSLGVNELSVHPIFGIVWRGRWTTVEITTCIVHSLCSGVNESLRFPS